MAEAEEQYDDAIPAFGDHILHVSEFKRKNSPQIVKIYGEQHLEDHSQKTQTETIQHFSHLLENDPKSHLYIEATPVQKERYGHTGVILHDIARRISKWPEPDRVHLIENRFDPESYPPDLQFLIDQKRGVYEPMPTRTLIQKVKARNFIRKNASEQYERFPAFKDIVERDTLNDRVGHPAFKSSMLDKSILDIINKEKGQNPIFYVGDAHRENLVRALKSHRTHKFTGDGLVFLHQKRRTGSIEGKC